LERDFKLEVGYRCPMPLCGSTKLDRAHLISWSESRDDSFGNQIMLCPLHHRMHTDGEIKTVDLRVLKARLAWENDRYTGTELKFLAVFSQLPGRYFNHPRNFRCCVRFLRSDGYIELLPVDGGPHPSTGTEVDRYRLTKTGRLLADVWDQSGAPREEIHHADD
jgi:hypothetical protein